MNDDQVYRTTTSRTFEETRKRVEEKAALQELRVLAVHDVKATLQEKGFSADPTVVIEVCNAKLASEALRLDERSALLMPCRIVIQEKNGEVSLSALLPAGFVEGEALKALAAQIGVKLMALMDAAASVPSCCRI